MSTNMAAVQKAPQTRRHQRRQGDLQRVGDDIRHDAHRQRGADAGHAADIDERIPERAEGVTDDERGRHINYVNQPA